MNTALHHHPNMQIWTRPSASPIQSLVASFVAWKLLLLLVAVCSPGPGYDTSTSLLSSHGTDRNLALPSALHYLVGKLVRWDAIYIVTVADRGYLFEQEWAFGWGLTPLIALFAAGGWYRTLLSR